MGSGFKVNPGAIRKLKREIEKEMAKTPVRIPVHADAPVGSARVSSTTGSHLELVIGWLIDWSYAYSQLQRSSVASVAEIMAVVEVQDRAQWVEPYAKEAVDSLIADGLARNMDTFDDSPMTRTVWLSAEGQREAVDRKERRNDNLARRTECRSAVLRWVYQQQISGESTQIADIAQSPYGWFNGVLFSPGDLTEAVVYLRQRKLLGGTDDILTLEDAGIECVEQHGGIVEYLNHRGQGAVNVTIMGNNSGQLAVANRDVEQTQSHTNDAHVLHVFAGALRELAQLAPSDRQHEFEQVATALDQEADKEHPDKSWIKSLLERGKGLLEQVDKLQNVAQLAKIVFDIYNQAPS